MTRPVRYLVVRRRSALAVAVLAGMCALVGSTAPVASAAESITIAAVNPVLLVANGETASVGVRMTFTGTPNPGFALLDRDLTVTWTVGGTLTVGTGSVAKSVPSTATSGVDYTSPTSGTVTFPAETPSGTVMTFPVVTAPHASPSVALTVNTSVVCTSGCTGVSTTAYSNDPTTVVINAHGFPYLNAALPVADRVSDLLSRMALDEKVGQMIEPERPAFTNANAQSNSGANNIRAWGVGSILSGGGSRPTPNTPTGWADLIDNFMVRSLATPHQIPLVYGLDTVHGDNNLQSATIFPHNIGIGATRDPVLSLLEGEVTAAETRATGPHWGFAPCICVARDIRWGRTYESYGEDPALVALMETEIDGMQGTTPTAKGGLDKILATAKHYAGDGGTTYGTGSGGRSDQGITQTSYDEFQRLFVSPYVPAVQVHHVGSIMPSYSSVDYTDDGLGNPVKMSAEANLLTTVLKQQLGFEGFLISDYNALDQIPTQPAPPDARTQQTQISVNAGMDMIMVPGQPAYKNTTNALLSLGMSGGITQARIDDAVARILRQKFELGLFDHPLTDRSNFGTVGSAANRAVARRAAAESQVLLANDGILPLAKTATVYLAGSNADNMGRQVGGWTGSWQGNSGNTGTDIPTGGTNLRTAIENVVGAGSVTFSATAVPAPAPGSADVGIVVVGETAYAEGNGDQGASGHTTLDITAADSTAIANVCAAMPCVVLVVSGRPMTITNTNPLSQMNALVESFLPGTEGAGVTDVLFGDTPFQGRLPQSWPRTLAQEPLNVGDAGYDPLFPFGWGLRTGTDFSTRSSLHSTRDSLAAIGGDAHVSAAVADLDRLLHAAVWNPDGSVSNAAAALALLAPAAKELASTQAESFTQTDGVVSVARDIAQASVVAKGGPTATTSPLIADADDELLTGHPDIAVALLTQAAGFAPSNSCRSGTVTGSMTVGAGELICLIPGARVTGPVTIRPGGTLYADGARLTGPVKVSEAAAVSICSSVITGTLTVTSSTGLVLVGGDAAFPGCAGNTITGPASLTANQAGVEFNGNAVTGPLTITGNTGNLPAPDSGPVHVGGNTVTGPKKIQG